MSLIEEQIADERGDLSRAEHSHSESSRAHTRRRRLAIWIPVFGTLLALLALLGWGLLRQQEGTPGVITNDGPSAVAVLTRPASDFTLPLYEEFDGQAEFRLADYRGKVVVVNFWASWCLPCREEAPALEQAWRAVGGQDVVFVGINTWDSERNALDYLQEFGITFPNAIDKRGKTAVEYGMMGIPETYFLTPDGMVSHKIIGAVNQSALMQGIADARQASGGAVAP